MDGKRPDRPVASPELIGRLRDVLLQPLGDEPRVGMDVHRLVTLRSGAELVRRLCGHDQHLAGVRLDLLGTDGEGGRTSPDDEGLGVRVPVQPWTYANLPGRLQDDRDVGSAGKLLVVLGPVLPASRPPVRSIR